LYNTFTNALNSSELVAQLVQNIQNALNSGNIFTEIAVLPGAVLQVTQLAATITSDVTELGVEVPTAVGQIPVCVTNEVATAAAQLNTIAAAVQTCVQSS
jgi:hypothetical protein